MSWVAAAVIGGSVVSSIIGGNAQKSAAETQANATRQASDQLLATGQEASKAYTPYQTTGTNALSDLAKQNAYLTTPGQTYQPLPGYQNFSNADLNANLAPNYAFQLGQGQASTNAANNALGGMNSGNAQQALQQYTQNYAGNAYQNALSNYMNQYSLGVNTNMAQQGQAFNQNQAQQTNIYNRLTGLAGLGLTGAQGSANAQLGTGTNIASLTAGLGNAQAASQIAQGNIYGNVANTAGNVLGYTALNRMSQPSSYQDIASSGGYSGSGNFNMPNLA
jgi:hypothetical protein